MADTGNSDRRIDVFIEKADAWQDELRALRAILLDCDLTETFKWRQPVYTHDGDGRAMPQWRERRTLSQGEWLVVSRRSSGSLDGRYFGPLPADAVLGRAQPILTRDAPGTPLQWRFGSP